MDIKRFIFDVDNTLIKSLDFKNSIREILKKHDLYSEHNVEAFLRANDEYDKTHDSYRKIAYIDQINKYIDGKIYIDTLNDYLKELKFNVKEIPGVENTLKFLKDSNYEVVCLTNYFICSQKYRLETVGLLKYIDHFYGEEHSKPSKASYLDACGSHKVEECVMVGDSYVLDVAVPSYLGLKTIYVNNSDKHYEDVIEVPSVASIDKDIIKKLSKN